MKIKAAILLLGLSIFSSLSGNDLFQSVETHENWQSWLQREVYIIKKFLHQNRHALFRILAVTILLNCLFYAVKLYTTVELQKIHSDAVRNYTDWIRNLKSQKHLYQSRHENLEELRVILLVQAYRYRTEINIDGIFEEITSINNSMVENNKSIISSEIKLAEIEQLLIQYQNKKISTGSYLIDIRPTLCMILGWYFLFRNTEELNY